MKTALGEPSIGTITFGQHFALTEAVDVDRAVVIDLATNTLSSADAETLIVIVGPTTIQGGTLNLEVEVQAEVTFKDLTLEKNALAEENPTLESITVDGDIKLDFGSATGKTITLASTGDQAITINEGNSFRITGNEDAVTIIGSGKSVIGAGLLILDMVLWFITPCLTVMSRSYSQPDWTIQVVFVSSER